jgi:uncharacterized membrane protein
MSSQTQDVTDDERPQVTPHPDRSRRGTDSSRWRLLGSALIGGALLLRGLRRRSISGLLGAVAGGWLLYRGLGQPDIKSKVASVRSERPRQSQTGAPPEALDVERSITVEAPPEELYERWREPETHEEMWAHFAKVTQTDEDTQHWAVGGPMDVSLEWDAEVTEDEPGEYLRWESLPGATVPNEGSVRFESRANGERTGVELRVRFDPPGGSLTTAAADRLDVVPETAARQALQRFKALVETGEIPTLEDNPSGRGRGDAV